MGKGGMYINVCVVFFFSIRLKQCAFCVNKEIFVFFSVSCNGGNGQL